jgi:thymidylate synthase (FAD)
MQKGHEIKVLDHGYVKLIDWMGSDAAVIEAARMSTGRGFVSWDGYRRCRAEVDGVICDLPQTGTSRRCDDCGNADLWQNFPRGDLGTLDYLYRNKHMTPFECGGEMMIEVQAPIFVFREWHRHRTASFNEFSARYSQMANLHYVPDEDRIQKQDDVNKQGSKGSFDPLYADAVAFDFRHEQEMVYENYDRLVKEGVAKEIARINTPVSRYSKMRAKTDLRNWLGFLNLRMRQNAQYEIRQYANAVAELIKGLWPKTYALFEEHDLYSVTLSQEEIRVVRDLLTWHEEAIESSLDPKAMWTRYGISEKNAISLLEKLKKNR